MSNGFFGCVGAGRAFLWVFLVISVYNAPHGQDSIEVLDEGCLMLALSVEGSPMGSPVDGIEDVTGPVVPLT